METAAGRRVAAVAMLLLGTGAALLAAGHLGLPGADAARAAGCAAILAVPFAVHGVRARALPDRGARVATLLAAVACALGFASFPDGWLGLATGCRATLPGTGPGEAMALEPGWYRVEVSSEALGTGPASPGRSGSYALRIGPEAVDGVLWTGLRDVPVNRATRQQRTETLVPVGPRGVRIVPDVHAVDVAFVRLDVPSSLALARLDAALGPTLDVRVDEVLGPPWLAAVFLAILALLAGLSDRAGPRRGPAGGASPWTGAVAGFVAAGLLAPDPSSPASGMLEALLVGGPAGGLAGLLLFLAVRRRPQPGRGSRPPP